LVGSNYINPEDNYGPLIDFLSKTSKLSNFQRANKRVWGQSIRIHCFERSTWSCLVVVVQNCDLHFINVFDPWCGVTVYPVACRGLANGAPAPGIQGKRGIQRVE